MVTTRNTTNNQADELLAHSIDASGTSGSNQGNGYYRPESNSDAEEKGDSSSSSGDDDDVVESSEEEDEGSSTEENDSPPPKNVYYQGRGGKGYSGDELTDGGNTVSTSLGIVEPYPKPNTKKLQQKKMPTCFTKKGHSKCKTALEKERAVADYGKEEATKHHSASVLFFTQLKDTKKELKKSEKKVGTLTNEVTTLRKQKQTLQSRLDTANSKFANAETKLKSQETTLSLTKTTHQSVVDNLDATLTQTKSQLKKEESAGKELTKDLRDAIAKKDAAMKSMASIQEKYSKLVMQVAEGKTGVQSGRKRSAEEDLQQKKDLIAYQSDVRLQEKISQAAIQQMAHAGKNKANAENRKSRISDVAQIASQMNLGGGGGLAGLNGMGNMSSAIGSMLSNSLATGGGSLGQQQQQQHPFRGLLQHQQVQQTNPLQLFGVGGIHPSVPQQQMFGVGGIHPSVPQQQQQSHLLTQQMHQLLGNQQPVLPPQQLQQIQQILGIQPSVQQQQPSDPIVQQIQQLVSHQPQLPQPVAPVAQQQTPLLPPFQQHQYASMQQPPLPQQQHAAGTGGGPAMRPSVPGAAHPVHERQPGSQTNVVASGGGATSNATGVFAPATGPGNSMSVDENDVTGTASILLPGGGSQQIASGLIAPTTLAATLAVEQHANATAQNGNATAQNDELQQQQQQDGAEEPATEA